MSDDMDFWTAVRDEKRRKCAQLGISCPGCRIKEPKRIPTTLMPSQKCKVCGMTYHQAMKGKG